MMSLTGTFHINKRFSGVRFGEISIVYLFSKRVRVNVSIIFEFPSYVCFRVNYRFIFMCYYTVPMIKIDIFVLNTFKSHDHFATTIFFYEKKSDSK